MKEKHVKINKKKKTENQSDTQMREGSSGKWVRNVVHAADRHNIRTTLSIHAEESSFIFFSLNRLRVRFSLYSVLICYDRLTYSVGFSLSRIGKIHLTFCICLFRHVNSGKYMTKCEIIAITIKQEFNDQKHADAGLHSDMKNQSIFSSQYNVCFENQI